MSSFEFQFKENASLSARDKLMEDHLWITRLDPDTCTYLSIFELLWQRANTFWDTHFRDNAPDNEYMTEWERFRILRDYRVLSDIDGQYDPNVFEDQSWDWPQDDEGDYFWAACNNITTLASIQYRDSSKMLDHFLNVEWDQGFDSEHELGELKASDGEFRYNCLLLIWVMTGDLPEDLHSPYDRISNL